MGAASSHTINSWTTCHSFVQREHTDTASKLSIENPIPPSHWSEDDASKYCFLQRNLSDGTSTYSSVAPGTALFQHWLANVTSSFDPRNDFPKVDVMKQYPDISEDENIVLDYENTISPRDFYTLWYTSAITPDAAMSGQSKGAGNRRRKRCHLTLHGVNYLPIVYYGGEHVRPYSSIADKTNDEVDVGGMFLRRHYDLGIWTINQNAPLEILVLPPPITGKPTVDIKHTNGSKHTFDLHSQSNGKTSYSRTLKSKQRDKANEPQGQGGDHDLAQSGAIMQCTAGWDWIQSTPDRNTGIWNKVEVNWVWGDVRLHNLRVDVVQISTDQEDEQLPLGDDIFVSASIKLSVTATFHGSESSAIMGKFHYEVIGPDGKRIERGTIGNIKIYQSITDFTLGLIQLPNVKLWWPHTHGSQSLYVVAVKFTSYNLDGDGLPVHESEADDTFGIRTISSYTHAHTNSLTVKVNGHPIFLVGGNWVTTDQFLRYATSQKRYLHELSHLKKVGFNAIRVWGGGIAETDYFYNAADKLGLLVYQEFWMTGDNNGRFAGSYDWPLDYDSYMLNAEDVITRLRNHPSLIMYGGGNELSPIPSFSESDTSPPKDIDESLRSHISILDGSRLYVSSSVTNVGSDFDPTLSLGPKDGPYGILDETKFFDRNPGLTTPLLSEDEIHTNASLSVIKNPFSAGRNIGFQTEIGSVSHPELDSLKKMLTQDALDSFPICRVTDEHSDKIHNEWRTLKYLPFTEDGGIDHICQFRYPPINTTSTSDYMDSISDYSWAAQLAQYFQYKALFEGYFHRMFESNSAVFMWKASSPAPTLRGALYDWFLETNGGYWGALSGIGDGNPVRVLLNQRDWSIHITNVVPLDLTATSLQWSAYMLDGNLVESGSIEIPHGGRILGNSVTHIEEKIPWVGGDPISLAADSDLQDVVFYRLEMAFQTSHTHRMATNSYYMTNPDMTEMDHQSRFAFLGYMRKVLPAVSITVSCIKQEHSNVNCTLHNNIANRLAIMVKLSLISDASYNDKDKRILPIYFSRNYISLLPEESVDVVVIADDVDTLCINGSLTLTENPGLHLMLSIDGWNVENDSFLISCDML